MQELLYTKDDSIYNYYRQFKDGVYKEIDEICLNMIKKFLEGTAEYELEEVLGVKRYRHNEARKDYRNGYRYRWFNTNYGDIHIKLGRLRNTSVEYSFIERYLRRSKKIDDMIRQMFFDGISARKIEKSLKSIFGNSYQMSAQTVSNITKTLNKEINRWLERPIEDKYEVIYLDGVYMNLKSPIKSRRRVVLTAYGVDKDGRGEVISFKVTGYGESEQAWSNFINELYYKGLEGKNLKLVVIDGNAGLKKAVELVWPYAKIQRCWVHKMRNVINYFPHRLREEAGRDLNRIYTAKSREQGIAEFRVFKHKWEGYCHKGVNCLEKDLEELFNYYDVADEVQISCKNREKVIKKIKTTNIIERIFREVRRRTRSIGLFNNRDSLVRILYSVFKDYSEKQKEKRKPSEITKSSLTRIYTQILT